MFLSLDSGRFSGMWLWLILTTFAFCFPNVIMADIIVYDPGELVMKEKDIGQVRANFSLPQGWSSKHVPAVSISDTEIATVGNVTTTRLTPVDFQIQFQVTGVSLGRTVAKISISNGSGDTIFPYDIAILRLENPAVTLAFTILVGIMICLSTFTMGTQLDWKIIRDVLKKPIAPVIGLTCQYLLMPLISFGWGQLLLRGKPNLQLGYFVVGCSPGGGASNQWTILLEGNLDISMTMTLLSNVLALAFMPMWLFTIGQMVIAKGTKVVIPFKNLFTSLVLFLAPAGLGILLHHFKPKWSEKIGKVLPLVMLIIILIMLTFGIYAVRYVFHLFTWRILVCGFLLPWSGFLLAGTAAWAFRQPWKNIITIAIETGIQNAGIAMAVLRFSLSEPDGDLATVLPVAALIFTPLPLAVLLLFIRGSRWMKQRKNKDKTAPIKESTQMEAYDNKAVDRS